MSRVGVLVLQGDFSRHMTVLQRLGCEVAAVREPHQLEGLDGLIIPGGESTTIGMLMDRFGLLESVRQRVRQGMGLFGTCAGAILMARDISGSDQPRLGLLDMTVVRNAYGRQIESFEAQLLTVDTAATNPAAGGLTIPAEVRLTAVFIRAPIITRVAPEVRVLAEFESHPVIVQQERLLAATFHPELTDDNTIHRHFLALIDRG